MKLSAFEKIIRKVVREEIDYALRREISLLKEELSTNSTTTLVKEIKEDPAEKAAFRSKIQSQLPTFNSGNSTLDSLLAETATTPSAEETFAQNDPVNQFINKDYRGLMEAMDNKKHFRP